MYQTGEIVLKDTENIFDIGMEVVITVNDIDVFSGNISGINITSIGTRVLSLNLIGKSYNLWREDVTEWVDPN
jgi:hypothetical protein